MFYPSFSIVKSKRIRRPKRPSLRIGNSIVASGVIPATYGRAELKHYDLSLVTLFSSVSTTPVTAAIGGMSQGTESYNRVGRAVMMHDLRLTGTLVGGQSNLGTDDAYNVFRIVVVEGTPGSYSGSTFTVDQVLDVRQVNGLVRVVYDKTLVLRSPGRDTTGYLPAVFHLDKTIPIKSLQTYNGSLETPTAYYITMVSDSALASNPGFVGGFYVLTFTDE